MNGWFTKMREKIENKLEEYFDTVTSEQYKQDLIDAGFRVKDITKPFKQILVLYKKFCLNTYIKNKK